MNFKIISLFAAIIATVSANAPASERTIRLDEIDSHGYYVQDWGRPVVNRSVVGTPLSVGGTKYEHGIGGHAISRMLFDLGGKAIKVEGLAGPDDTNLFATKLEFKIIGDGKELWQSGVMSRGDAAKEFDVDLRGIDKVLLLIDMCDDEFMYDHGDWIDVRFTTVDDGEVKAIPVMPKAISKEACILTPEAQDAPLINNPKVYGATPGADFLWSVMASGQQPMTYSAEGLPEGLVIDETTGIITGAVKEKGDYKVRLTAKNDAGADETDVTIKIGDTISLTPIMGWSSWNCCRFNASDSILRRTTDIMYEKLHPYGWTFVSVDDGWAAKQRSADGTLQPNGNWKDMKALSDYMHSKGMKFGIYSSPGPTTCGDYPASYGHEYTDAKTWADWGVDYLKYDYCSHTQVEKDSSEGSIRAPYDLMRAALDSAGRDIVYCVGYGAPRVWVWGAEAGGNLWRTTRDITDEWNVVQAIGNCQDVCAPATAPGRFNDPDMMVVGHVGGGWGTPKHPTMLTPDEQYSHVSLWAILSAPLLLGCDMELLDDFTLSLLTNREVIAVNQDELCSPAVKLTVENGQIWYKPLADGSVAVGCFNFDPYFVLWDQTDGEAMQLRDYKFTVNPADFGVDGAVTVRDIWRNEDLASDVSTPFDVTVPYHGVKLLKLTPETKK
ncbi:MAG: NPCBM/NEW2 domain-containing protein [Muribaculaceae bacterium]|nr:NPCBM/NEW2 domain-containing protein [Muribaculaceae bacterium]